MENGSHIMGLKLLTLKFQEQKLSETFSVLINFLQKEPHIVGIPL